MISLDTINGLKLVMITRDQTMAQAFIDEGVMTRSDAANTRLDNILTSAIGGSQATPVVTRVDDAWDLAG